MECLKCGKATDGNQVFCSECLEDMANYPVNTSTSIHIPVRPTSPEKAAPRTRERTPSETIASLQTLIRWLTVTIAVLSLLLCATAGFLIHTLETKEDASNKIGWNYTTNIDLTNP